VMARRVTFSEEGARRVIAATRAYERGNRDQPPIKFRQPVGDGGGDLEIRVAIWKPESGSDTWGRSEIAQAALCDEEGVEISPQILVPVSNLITPLGPTSGDYRIVIGSYFGNWQLLEYDPRLIKGYDPDVRQILSQNNGGILEWLDVENC